MEMITEILLVVLAFILLIIGIIGSVVPMLPGPPLSFLGLMVMKWSGHGNFSPFFLWLWAGIVVAVTVMDYTLPAFMAKKFGGSKAASIGSVIGLIIGIFVYPPWGMLLGPFLGALIGELIHNNRDGAKAFKVALGAFLAFIVGSGAKLITTSLILFFAIRALIN
ncbi:MAG: DUF456 domain-containing protein [Treponema sp.]|nr:DUF456 domain-containing protein [Treponema sp.]